MFMPWSSGAGPDLVLIHGASGNTRDFTFDLVDRLDGPLPRDRASTVPGWAGRTAAGDCRRQPARAGRHPARRQRASLALHRPIVVGHSYGGAVAMAWALRDPGDTAALVILGGRDDALARQPRRLVSR